MICKTKKLADRRTDNHFTECTDEDLGKAKSYLVGNYLKS